MPDRALSRACHQPACSRLRASAAVHGWLRFKTVVALYDDLLRKLKRSEDGLEHGHGQHLPRAKQPSLLTKELSLLVTRLGLRSVTTPLTTRGNWNRLRTWAWACHTPNTQVCGRPPLRRAEREIPRDSPGPVPCSAGHWEATKQIGRRIPILRRHRVSCRSANTLTVLRTEPTRPSQGATRVIKTSTRFGTLQRHTMGSRQLQIRPGGRRMLHRLPPQPNQERARSGGAWPPSKLATRRRW